MSNKDMIVSYMESEIENNFKNERSSPQIKDPAYEALLEFLLYSDDKDTRVDPTTVAILGRKIAEDLDSFIKRFTGSDWVRAKSVSPITKQRVDDYMVRINEQLDDLFQQAFWENE